MTLERCLRSNVTLNPRKCRFEVERIEYVGHTIDAQGISFSREKLDSVLAMPKPATKGDMKIFLGMVNYFHAHIARLSSMEAPLTQMIGDGYTRGKRQHVLVGQPAGTFHDIKIAVDACPKLFSETPI